MNVSQREYGEQKLRDVALAWGVSRAKAAGILYGSEHNKFWEWVEADEFLITKLHEYSKGVKDAKTKNN